MMEPPRTPCEPVAACACAICLSPMERGLASTSFETPCCGQLLHLTCMCDWKQLRGACPLCRSDVSTGLTPAAPAVPPEAAPGAPTGFVSSSDLYAAMMRRRAAAAPAQPAGGAAATDTLLSPGVDGAFQEALSQQRRPPDYPEY